MESIQKLEEELKSLGKQRDETEHRLGKLESQERALHRKNNPNRQNKRSRDSEVSREERNYDKEDPEHNKRSRVSSSIISNHNHETKTPKVF
jgi:hypothetical protein